jgi:hypothetical protein
VDGVLNILVMGFMTYKIFIVSFMGSFVEGVLQLHFQCILFPILFIAFFFNMFPS